MLSLIYNNLPSLPQTFQRLKNILYIPKMDTDSSNPGKWYEPLILKAKDYDFNEPVSKSDKEFWQGVGAKIYDDDDEIKCILHVNTNLIITYEGKIIGRQTDDGIIYIEDLDPKIIQWYMNCGF